MKSSEVVERIQHWEEMPLHYSVFIIWLLLHISLPQVAAATHVVLLMLFTTTSRCGR